MELKFFVPGTPKTAGSKKAFKNKHTGKIMVVDTCDNKDWKTAVATKAAEAMQGNEPSLNPISIVVCFRLPRPKSHYGKRKGMPYLKENSPEKHTIKPDATKLFRCLEDALTGIVWKDDSQVCNQTVLKVYNEICGAYVYIEM